MADANQRIKETTFTKLPSSNKRNSESDAAMRASPLPWLYNKPSKASLFTNLDLENPRCSTIVDESDAFESSERNWDQHHRQKVEDLTEKIAVAAAAAVGVEPNDPMIRMSLKKKERNSLRSRRRRRMLQSTRSSIVKLARNKFEQDEADVLNIYAKVNGGELLGNSNSYGGILKSHVFFLES